MLPQRDITAWQVHAPWPSAYQIEQDLLLTQCVEAIFSDAFLRDQVAMRGGTVLHKVHLAPAGRYSEDIDLVAVGTRPPGHIMRAIKRVVSPIFNGAPPTADVRDRVRLAFRNVAQRSEIRRMSWEYRTTSEQPPSATLKIEVNVSERTPFLPVVALPLYPSTRATPVEVISFDVNEMLGTKMRALIQRERGRDLFDLAHAWEVCSAPSHPHVIDPTAVASAFTHYMTVEGSRVSAARYRDLLAERLAMPRFRADMADLLSGAVAYDVDKAAALVESVYIAALPI